MADDCVAASFKGTLLRCEMKPEVDPQKTVPGQGVMKSEHAGPERLRKENAKLRIERDLLKKAAAYFARESM